MSHPIEHLRSLEREAEQLLASHEGVHNMHGARWAIRGWYEIGLKRGVDEVNWNDVESLITKMRWCNANGRYPRRDEVK